LGEESPTNSCRCSEREDAEGVETSREALRMGARESPRVRVSGKLEALGSGSVLGSPLKRSRSPREDPGDKLTFVSGGLEREDPEALAFNGKGH